MGNLKRHMEKHKENRSQEIHSQENVQPAVPINTVFTISTQATLSQNRSIMPSFDSNYTQVTYKGQKEVPKLPKEDPRVSFMRFESNLEKPKVPKDPKLFNCEICSASFKFQKSLKHHMEKKHKERIKMSKDPK